MWGTGLSQRDTFSSAGSPNSRIRFCSVPARISPCSGLYARQRNFCVRATSFLARFVFTAVYSFLPAHVRSCSCPCPCPTPVRCCDCTVCDEHPPSTGHTTRSLAFGIACSGAPSAASFALDGTRSPAIYPPPWPPSETPSTRSLRRQQTKRRRRRRSMSLDHAATRPPCTTRPGCNRQQHRRNSP